MAIDENGKEVIRMAMRGGRVVRRRQRQRREFREVMRKNRAPAIPPALNASELMDSQGGLQIHHVVFESTLDDFVVLESGVAVSPPRVVAHAVESEHLQSADILLV